MRRRKRHTKHVNHERWLVSYADFITLLFAVFVVMYAASQVDHKKISKLSQAIQSAFQDLGVFQSANSRQKINKSQSLPSSETDSEKALTDSGPDTTEIRKVLAPTPGPKDAQQQSPFRDARDR